MDLREWMILHVKHKDAFARQLRDVKETADGAVFTFPDQTLTGYALEQLRVPAVTENALIVTLQTKENVERLLKEWPEFSKHPRLTIVFANPGRHEKWLIKPHLHAQISDGNVEQGVWSMAESVTFV